MNTNNTNEKLIYPELSYLLTGIFFEIHNKIGRYSREKQYGDYFEQKLKEIRIPYKREYNIEKTNNIADFIVDNKIVVELKAKRITEKNDYYQIQRYLQTTKLKLGLLVNFRNRFLKPARIVRIDTVVKNKFV